MLRSSTPRTRAALLQHLGQQQAMPPIYGGIGEGLARAGSQMVDAYVLKQLLDKEASAENSAAMRQNRAMQLLLGGSESPFAVGPSPAPGSQQALLAALGADPSSAGQLIATQKALQPDPVEYGPVQQGMQDGKSVFFQMPKNGNGRPMIVGGISPPIEAGKDEKLGLMPLFGKDADGNTVVMQLGDKGNLSVTKMPQGVQAQMPTYSVDTGTGTQVINRAGGQTVREIPKDVAGEAVAKETGKGLAERELMKPKSSAALQAALTKIDYANQLIDQIDASGGLSRATGPIGAMPNWPGSEAADVTAKIETLRAKNAFQELADMRAASPTGGALGQVTERELELLMNSAGSLDQSQSTQAFRQQLARMRTQLANSRANLLKAYKDTYGDSFGGDGWSVTEIE